MRNIIAELHQLFSEQKRFNFPFEQFKKEIPKNGLYIFSKTVKSIRTLTG